MQLKGALSDVGKGRYESVVAVLRGGDCEAVAGS